MGMHWLTWGLSRQKQIQIFKYICRKKLKYYGGNTQARIYDHIERKRKAELLV
jgi:hypothetical protein